MVAGQVIQMLMSRLQAKNPRGYKVVSEAMRNNGNPEPMLKQLMSNISPEQKQSILNQAKGYGVPDNILSQIQNMK